MAQSNKDALDLLEEAYWDGSIDNDDLAKRAEKLLRQDGRLRVSKQPSKIRRLGESDLPTIIREGGHLFLYQFACDWWVCSQCGGVSRIHTECLSTIPEERFAEATCPNSTSRRLAENES